MDPCIYQDITRRSQQISQLKLLGLGIAEAKAYIQVQPWRIIIIILLMLSLQKGLCETCCCLTNSKVIHCIVRRTATNFSIPCHHSRTAKNIYLHLFHLNTKLASIALYSVVLTDPHRVSCV